MRVCVCVFFIIFSVNWPAFAILCSVLSIVGHRRFGTKYLIVIIGRTCFPESLVIHYQSIPRKIPQERKLIHLSLPSFP